MSVSAENASVLSRANRGADWLLEHNALMRVLYTLIDVVTVVLATATSYWIVFGFTSIPSDYRVAILVFVLFTWIVFNASGLYGSWRGRGYVDLVKTVLIAWVFVVCAVMMGAYILDVGADFPREWMLLAMASSLALVTGVRVGTMAGLRRLRTRGMNHKRLLVVGAGQWGAQVVENLHNAEWLGMQAVGFLDSNVDLHGEQVAGVPVLGGIDVIEDAIAAQQIDEVWLCLPLQSRTGSEDRIRDVMNSLRHSTVTQRLVPDLEEMRLLNQPVTEIMGMPVVNLNTSPMVGTNRIVKALEDRILAATILILISPIMLLIAAAIKMDSPGPVLFRQLRHGWDGKPIRIYKFRTMKQHEESDGTVTQASRNDSRITRIGAFLRRTSLDELPQFFNVLQGKMSIVGPRPHAIEHNKYYMDQIDSYMQRHKVKPGITGWAQINGFRGETESVEKMRQRVNYDLYYIEHWSIWFDLKIIGRTLFTGFVHENAY